NLGTSYSLLGNASRITSGWELTGLTLPVGGAIRARARITDGKFNGSSTLIEQVLFYSAMTTTNLSAAESFVEDTPLNLADIVISNATNVTATLTLSTNA